MMPGFRILALIEGGVLRFPHPDGVGRLDEVITKVTDDWLTLHR
jgi:hypothetical protein